MAPHRRITPYRIITFAITQVFTEPPDPRTGLAYRIFPGVDVAADGTKAKLAKGDDSTLALEQAKEEDWLAANILKPCLKQVGGRVCLRIALCLFLKMTGRGELPQQLAFFFLLIFNL